jgi:colanic acid biosynthesis protein WcaH
MAAFLSQPDFNTVVRLAPLVSIDLIVRDPDDRVFLGLRNNEPAKDHFFVPGGIILKNETLADAFARIVKREINYSGAIGEATLLGIYDHFYDTNAAGEPGYGTRYVVLAHEIRPRDLSRLSVDSQHREFGWWTEAQILASDRVHDHTKAYFRTR